MTNLVEASWRRCRSEFDLESRHQPSLFRVSESELRNARSRLEGFEIDSDSAIGRVRQAARSGDCCVLLSDTQGVVVQSYADTCAAQELAKKGLSSGYVWREDLVGTNGIGTCLAACQAVTVDGPSHYFEALKSYSCTAAPILGPEGEIIGVLDVSGHQTLGSDGSFLRAFVQDVADQISGGLFRRRYREEHIIAISDKPLAIPDRLNALIALDEDGQILGATREALSLLGVGGIGSIIGLAVDRLWNVPMADISPLVVRSTQLGVDAKSAIYATSFKAPPEMKCPPRCRNIKETMVDATSDTNAFDLVAGKDRQLLSQVELWRKLLNSDIPLLLLGETGVGKDTFARTLHSESQRSDKPYVAVNCAAIPESLLASELFGYAPGTFTGGLKGGRTGKIVESNGGTLFLDEIGDMPLELQAHLLRVLEERKVTPLGSSCAVPVDARIICATHRDLPALVERGAFRKDLYFRIKGVQIVLPPLRERSDIIDVAYRIIRDEVGPDAAGIEFSEDAIEAIKRYAWPGNVRELKNVIRYVLDVHAEKTITPAHLPRDIVNPDRPSPSDNSGQARNDCYAQNPELRLSWREEKDRQAIVAALRASKWNVTEAAQSLKISRVTLHRKIRRYEIVSPNNMG